MMVMAKIETLWCELGEIYEDVSLSISIQNKPKKDNKLFFFFYSIKVGEAVGALSADKGKWN